MASSIECLNFTPEQEREIDRDVDQGMGNYGQVIARVTGVDVFAFSHSQVKHGSPVPTTFVPRWQANNWSDMGESSKRKPSPYGTAE